MAYIPGSVRVGGFIAPTDSTDTYPTHDDLYGKGGYKVVANNTARDAISAGRRKEGMLVRVLDAGGGVPKFYTLVGGTTNAHWQEQQLGTVETSTVQHVLNASEVINGYADLGITPTAPDQAVLIIRGAPGTYQGDTADFVLNSAGLLNWSGRALDGVLESGDQLTVIYK